jgi:hypothetical protein
MDGNDKRITEGTRNNMERRGLDFFMMRVMRFTLGSQEGPDKMSLLVHTIWVTTVGNSDGYLCHGGLMHYYPATDNSDCECLRSRCTSRWGNCSSAHCQAHGNSNRYCGDAYSDFRNLNHAP